MAPDSVLFPSRKSDSVRFWCAVTDSMLDKNLQALETIYPSQARLIRSTSPSEIQTDIDGDALRQFVDDQMENRWNVEDEFYLIDRFAGTSLAHTLFDRLQLETLRSGKNRRLILLEDRLELVRRQFEDEDWRTLSESEMCLFLLSPDSLKDLQRLVHRYPDIAASSPVCFSGDPGEYINRVVAIQEIFVQVQKKLTLHNKAVVKYCTRKKSAPFSTSVRFFTPGHNYLQEACVRAFRRMGYGAERLQWKNPLYRFVRSTAWFRELEQNPFDLALFLNATPNTFGGDEGFSQLPLRKTAWFVDNPRRYGFDPSDYTGCDVIGVFDRTYIPWIRERSPANIVEIRTAFGIDPSQVQFSEEFSAIDVAFVGELGAQGFVPLEKGFLSLAPEVAATANTLLREVDIAQPVHLAPFAEEAFTRLGWPYQGALVEFLENKAAALRRRYFLDVLADRGLVIFGNDEWKNDPGAGPLRACYGGRRISYGAELASLYASVKININIFHAQCVSAPNPRVYDVLASGGFLFTTDVPGLRDEFEPGKDLVVFHSREELLEMLRYYLARPGERKAIAQSGRKRALASCGYHDRMQVLLSALSESSGDNYVDLCR